MRDYEGKVNNCILKFYSRESIGKIVFISPSEIYSRAI
jgi:hypothetical protein